MGQFLHFHPITTAALLIFGSALYKGGPAERWGALLMVADWAFSLAAVELFSHIENGVHVVPTTPTLVLDFLFALGLLVLALRYGKLWLGSAMILQSVMLAMHAMELSSDAPGFVFYAATINLLTCLVLVNLLLGTLGAWRTRSTERRTQASSGLAAA